MPLLREYTKATNLSSFGNFVGLVVGIMERLTERVYGSGLQLGKVGFKFEPEEDKYGFIFPRMEGVVVAWKWTQINLQE